MHSTLQTIGIALRQARRAAPLSQAALAQSLGMSRATISGIENGTVREIGVRKLMAVCAALNLELSVRPLGARPTLQQLRQEQRASKLNT
jgi:HTH-type transcriptional regulator / antitoxin HipB